MVVRTLTIIAFVFTLALSACVKSHRIDYTNDVVTPTLMLVEQPVVGTFTHPAFAYHSGVANAQWEMIELLDNNGPTWSSPPRIRDGRIRGRWSGDVAKAFWSDVVGRQRYRNWFKPYELGDSNAWAKWVNTLHPLDGFDLGTRAYGENNDVGGNNQLP